MRGPREVAARVLVRVEKEHAFAAAALEAELVRAADLEARDRALATELVYGTLRVSPWLEAQIAPHAPRGTAKLDAFVRACLALAAYQLYFMRVPAFAAVNEAVGAIREVRGPRVGAFANAVLRKLAAQAAEARAGEGAEARLLGDATVDSTPAWLREALERSLGPEGARSFLLCSVDAPAVALRVEGAIERAAERDAWVERLRAAAPDAAIEPGRASPLAILVRGAGKPQKLPGYADGAWSVQEEGSQVAALSLGARPGETVLDACAGRGNKTALLARAVGSTGAVDACDASPAKLERLGEELTRVGLRARATYAVDWSVGSGEVEGTYDRVLVDAPCSGVGTLRRRPEIALRRKAEDLSALALVQGAIARRAATHVRPGGTLAYVVCSVLREEGEAVIDTLREALPDFEALEPSFRLLPQVHGTDGYFVAKLVRR
ncbi:MAG TPA: transcription antitermination factor NusB [Polyangiaceae bacterium]|nr:transcription antitermination factor NusB [Polyangiaceae bacterium]